MSNEEINVFRNGKRSLQVRPRGYAIELDSIELKAFILQIDNVIRNKALGSVWIGVEYPVAIPRYKDSELCGDGSIPGEEVV